MSVPREKLQEAGKNQVSASKEFQRIRKVRTDAIKKEEINTGYEKQLILLEYLKNLTLI